VKTADERVASIAQAWNDPDLNSDRCFDRIKGELVAFARDQRHLCAEAVNAVDVGFVDSLRREIAGQVVGDGRNAAVNAPEPGK
jgi:hypothetical protein